MKLATFAATTLLAASVALACRARDEHDAVDRNAHITSETVQTSSPPPAPPIPPAREARPPASRVERLDVPRDLPAVVVRAESKEPRVAFLPGMCSNAVGYLHTFPEAAHAHGGVLGIDGDRPCGETGEFHTFSWDAKLQHDRLMAAFAASGASSPSDLTLVGYSQGASIAEQLAKRLPDTYRRIVLIGAPTDPNPANFARASAVVTMSCSRDVPARMKRAANAIQATGVPATYFEMPNCTHGNVTEGNRIFNDVFVWLRDNERAKTK